MDFPKDKQTLVCQGFEYLAHQNAAHIGLKFNKIKFELNALYSEEFVMSKRQEFFRAYIIKDLKHNVIKRTVDNAIIQFPSAKRSYGFLKGVNYVLDSIESLDDNIDYIWVKVRSFLRPKNSKI